MAARQETGAKEGKSVKGNERKREGEDRRGKAIGPILVHQLE